MDTRGKEAAALALHRFGFGPSRNSITAIAADLRGALLSDLDRPGAGFLSAKLPSSATAARAISDFRAEEQARSKLAQRAKKEAEAGMASTSDAATITPPKPSGPPLPQQVSRTKPRRATRRRSMPISASSNGLYGSGRTTSAFQPIRTSRPPALMSARRSAPMCSGVSPTC